jgi:hypothetical protein
MKKLIFISLIISILCSCGKNNGNTVVSGRVLEKGSNTPVANARVIFSQCVQDEGTFSSSVCADVATVLTNAQGEYTFSKEDDEPTNYYRIRAERTNYGKPVEVFQTADAGKSTKNLNFTLPAYAWIKFHVKNMNPFDDSDLIIAPGSSGKGNHYHYGTKVDTNYVIKGLGNFNNAVYPIVP